MAKVVWLTGLPCSGKTTIGYRVVQRLRETGEHAALLDGDVMRGTAISSDLGFRKKDREKHLARMADVANLLATNGVTVVACFVSPYAETRQMIRERVTAEFIEVFVDAPAGVCMQRDVKGMYGKAVEGVITNFTGVTDRYDRPEDPDIHIDTVAEDVELSVNRVLFESGVMPDMRPGALFIGRWQPLHKGHDYLVRQALGEGKKVIIGIRRTEVNDSNPLSVADRKKIIGAAYAGEDVEVVVVPDIESVNIGRKVGYEVNRIDAPDDVEGISATEIRRQIAAGDNSWIARVPIKAVNEIREAFDA